MTTPATEGAASVNVLVVDDQTLFRSGLAQLLERDPRLHVVGEAADGEEAVALSKELNPDVVLMDLKMPKLDGIEATRRLIQANPRARVLILSTFETDGYVLQAMRAGAQGYVLKDAQPEAIASSILAVVAGERVLAGAVAERVVGMITGSATPKDFYNGLSAREIEVLRLLAGGLANKQIAYQLGISDKTVRNHVSNIYEKLRIYDRAQAVLYAVRKGLVDL
ncbi:MAG: response regulator [Candidatus Dormibacterales bacterium]